MSGGGEGEERCLVTGSELHVSKMLLRIQFISSCRCRRAECGVRSAECPDQRGEPTEQSECFRKRQKLPETRAISIFIIQSKQKQKCEHNSHPARQPAKASPVGKERSRSKALQSDINMEMKSNEVSDGDDNTAGAPTCSISLLLRAPRSTHGA